MALTSKPAEPGIPTLVKSAASDTAHLLNQQIALAKAELKQSARTAGKSMTLLGVGLFVLTLGIVFLLVTLAYVLVQLGLPTWAGFGIVTLVLLILGSILAYVGVKKAQGIKGPERAMAQFQATSAALRDE